MRAEVTRRVRFEAAHFLPNHQGECRKLHGHSWQAWVTVEGEIEHDGMVVDMGHLASFFRDDLEPELDHAVLNELGAFAPSGKYAPPSTENVARYLLDAFLEAGFPVECVTVQETENQTATVHA